MVYIFNRCMGGRTHNGISICTQYEKQENENENEIEMNDQTIGGTLMQIIYKYAVYIILIIIIFVMYPNTYFIFYTTKNSNLYIFKLIFQSLCILISSYATGRILSYTYNLYTQWTLNIFSVAHTSIYCIYISFGMFFMRLPVICTLILTISC
eukprot:313568_1